MPTVPSQEIRAISRHPVLKNNLVAYYSLDGSANDVVGSNNGTLSGSPYYTQGLNFGSIRLSGSNQYINLGDDSALNPSLITVSAWAKSDLTTGDGVVLSRDGTNPKDSYTLRKNDSTSPSKWEWGIATSSGMQTVVGSNVVADTWTHLMGTFDGSDIYLYIDGVLSAQTPITGTTIRSSNAWTLIGAQDAPLHAVTRFFDGDIQDVAIWDTAHTELEAWWLCNGQRGRTYKNEKLWALGGAGIGLVTDDSGRLELSGANAIKFDPASQNNDFSIAAEFIWGKIDDPTTTGIGTILSKYDSSANDCSYWLTNTNDMLVFGVSKTGVDANPDRTELMPGTGILETGCRYRAVADYQYVADGSSIMRLKVVKVAAGTQTTVADLSTATAVGPIYSSTAAPFLIGSRAGGTYQSFRGVLLWTAYKNAVVTSDERADLLAGTFKPEEIFDQDEDFFDDFQNAWDFSTNWNSKLPQGPMTAFSVGGTVAKHGSFYELASWWPNGTWASWVDTERNTPGDSGRVDLVDTVEGPADDFSPFKSGDSFSVMFEGILTQSAREEMLWCKSYHDAASDLNREWELIKNSDNTVSFRVSSDGDTYSEVKSATITIGEAVKVLGVYTYNGSGSINDMRLYVNSTTPVTKADAVGPIHYASTKPPRIGYYHNGFTTVKTIGKYAYAAYWADDLTVVECTSIMSGGACPSTIQPTIQRCVDFHDYNKYQNAQIQSSLPDGRYHFALVFEADWVPNNAGSPLSVATDRETADPDSYGYFKSSTGGRWRIFPADGGDLFDPAANNNDFTAIAIAMTNTSGTKVFMGRYGDGSGRKGWGVKIYQGGAGLEISSNGSADVFLSASGLSNNNRQPIMYVFRYKYNGAGNINDAKIDAYCNGSKVTASTSVMPGPVFSKVDQPFTVFAQDDGWTGNDYEGWAYGAAYLNRYLSDAETENVLLRKTSIADLEPDWFDPMGVPLAGTKQVPVIGNLEFEIVNPAAFSISSSHLLSRYAGLPTVAIYPQVVSAVASADNKVQVTFDMEMEQSDPGAANDALNLSNYQLTTVLGVSRAVNSVSLVQGDPTIVELTLDGEMTNGVNYTVTVSNVESTDGSLIDPSYDDYTFTGLGTAPQLVSASIQSRVVVRVTFNEAMLNNAALTNPTNYVITGNGGLAVYSVTVVDSTHVDLYVSQMEHGVTYIVEVSNVQDTAYNIIDAAHDTATFVGVSLSLIIWVSKEGNDTTGDGSQQNPYLTIERARQDFQFDSQIRILDGLYTPPDTLVFENLYGSIFAETPNGVEIQPQQTTTNGACISITNSSRFLIQGIKVLQSENAATNPIGIYANEVENFTCNTCTISDFISPSGDTYGIYAYGSGRIEDCVVEDLDALTGNLCGIKADGVAVIDCTVRRLSGGASCTVLGIYETDTDSYTV